LGSRLGSQAQSPLLPSPGQGRPKTPVWREVHDKVLNERGLVGSGIGLQPSEPTMRGSQGSPSDAVFGMLDRNHDGVITRGEWSQAMQGQPVPYGVGTRPAMPGRPGVTTAVATNGAAPGGAGAGRSVGSGDLSGMRRNLAAQSYRVQALAAEDPLAQSPDRPGSRPTSTGPPRASMQELRKGIAAAKQEQELQVAFVQDAVREAEQTRSSISGLALERDRLQRQVQDMRGQVAETKSELSSQNEQHRLQTQDLRSTVADLQSEASRMQAEQRRQAKMLNDGKTRGSPSDNPGQFTRQVDDVKGVVASQEQKLARIEETLSKSNAAQQNQLQDALSQGKQLSRALEEEAHRRNQSVAELQNLILQERGRENGMSTKLQSELTKATQQMQDQTGSWMELARVMKGEVASLAGELRNDRESRSLEASSQRYEITRMLEETRLANVASTVGGWPGGLTSGMDADLGTDMMSRAGAVAVHKMVDTTKALLHGLEEALILRAGFIAGVFHTWRCEVTLLKVARRYSDEFARHQDEWSGAFDSHRQSFEDELRKAAEHHLSHKEIVKQRVALLIDKWAHGEAEGLKRECLRCWCHYATHERCLKRSAESIHKACFEWIEGKTQALRHACFRDWKNTTQLAATERKAHGMCEDLAKQKEQELTQALNDAESKIAAGMSKIETMHKSARKDLEVVLAKWERGSKQGLLTAVLQSWKMFVQSMRSAKKQSAAAQEAVNKFLGGSKLGLLKSLYGAWSQEIFHSNAIKAEKRRFDELLTNDRAERERDEAATKDVLRQKIDAAHEAVAMTLKKWELGESKGCLKDVWDVWSGFSKKTAQKDRRTQAVHLQMEKWIEGEKRGRLHSCWTNWKHHSHVAALERKAEVAVASEQQRLEQMLADHSKAHESELEKMQNEVHRRKEQAHETLKVVMAKWEMGDKKGLMETVLRDWNKTVMDIKRSARKRNAVHMALLKSLEGAARAMMQLTFVEWKACSQEQRRGRGDDDKIASERRHWEEREKQLILEQEQVVQGSQSMEAVLRGKAHAQSEMMLKKWMGGDSKGTLGTIFVDWRRLKDTVKDKRRRQKSVQDSMQRFLLGEQKGMLSSTFKGWYNMWKSDATHRDAVAKLEKQVEALMQKHELHLTKYATILGSGEGAVMKGMVFNSWREVSQGIKSLETEREREVELEEMKRAHDIAASTKLELQAKAALAMGAKSSRLILVEIFMVWKVQYEKEAQERQIKFSHNKAMKEFATQQIMKAFKKDSAALLASCFAEWHHEGKIMLHQEAHLDAQRRLEEHGVYSEQLQFRVQGLEEQLWAAYRQIDHITETLQKELQTKSELTEELRDAYGKMRHAFTPTAQAFDSSGNLQAMGSRPSSAQSRSQSTSRLDRDRRLSSGSRLANSGPLVGRGEPPIDAAFNALDRDNDGVITRDEWNQAMRTGGNTREVSALVSPPTTTFARPSSGGAQLSRPVSPRCDWDEVVKKMKAERLLAAQQEPS